MYQTIKELVTGTPTRIGRFHAFAEAIRAGCRIYPKQAYGTFVNRTQNAACAIAAARAAGYDLSSRPYALSCCPAKCTAIKFGVLATIVHLNDEHRWSRERIADWLDTL